MKLLDAIAAGYRLIRYNKAVVLDIDSDYRNQEAFIKLKIRPLPFSENDAQEVILPIDVEVDINLMKLVMFVNYDESFAEQVLLSPIVPFERTLITRKP